MTLEVYLSLLVLCATKMRLAEAVFWSSLNQKCMGELGCFKTNPFTLWRPFDRAIINTSFSLYTPTNVDNPHNFSNIYGNINTILSSPYNAKANTKFVVGGYISDTSGEWKKPMVNALVKENGNNVFLVDWHGGDGLIYDDAVANTRVVGAEIALFVQRLQEAVGLKPENVHIIGHSLGSQIAGFAGKKIKNLGRITGLDPAGPSFTDVDQADRLDRNDALFVDVIHTDMASSLLEGLGLKESIGHFDFYPNGGHHQPGCESPSFAAGLLSYALNPDKDKFIAMQCSHLRALYLFLASIENIECKLWGAVCDSWEDYNSGKCGSCKDGQGGLCIPLGIHADQYASKVIKNKSIDIFLNTTAAKPFCR